MRYMRASQRRLMATKTNTEVNGHKYYRITRTIGHKIVDGKKVPIKKQFLGTSKGAAEKKYDAYLKEQARIRYEGEQIMDIATFNFRAKEYIDNALTVSAKYADGTKDVYEGAYHNHVEGTWLDKMCVRDIKAATIQKFYNELDVSKSTLKRINKFMSAMYTWMVRNDYANNVLDAVEMPEKEDTTQSEEIIIWNDTDLHYLVSRNFDFRADFLIKLMSYTGMRIGECLGLRYGDIWDSTVHVSRQYNLGSIKAPKYNSKRDIPMHFNLIVAYARHKAWHEEEMRQSGYKTDYIFTTKYGTLYEVANLRRAFNRFYKREKIEPQTFKTYRSTFCTNLCKAGVPLEVASKLLGHKSLEVTAKYYALIHKETKREAIDKLRL